MHVLGENDKIYIYIYIYIYIVVNRGKIMEIRRDKYDNVGAITLMSS